MPKALIPLAQGCEELEAVTIIDLLRRANFDVVTAGLDAEPVKASRGVVLIPDTTIDEAVAMKGWDAVVLPGGLPGADNLAGCKKLIALVKTMNDAGKLIAAICAAPRVLAKAGLLDGKTVTAYPGFINAEDYPKVNYTGGTVETDGNIITSRGPGTAMDFALTLIAYLDSEKTRKTVEDGLVRSPAQA